MSSENLPAVDFLAEQGAVAAVRARVKGNRIKAEVVLYCCRAHEISEDWFSRPVCAPNDWSPFRAEEDAREGANGRRLPSVRNRSVERPERTPVRLRQTGTPTRASRVSGRTGTERRGRWVRPAGIEPATKCLEGTCSIR